ncbi:hypothetical protein V8G54_022615 [Vigna mungo]|uniref:Uncharacterized protein n=1 Tax=Vigna mungo TaxID=3915 RepID=A0AAQ3RNF9_VIGMU
MEKTIKKDKAWSIGKPDPGEGINTLHACPKAGLTLLLRILSWTEKSGGAEEKGDAKMRNRGAKGKHGPKTPSAQLKLQKPLKGSAFPNSLLTQTLRDTDQGIGLAPFEHSATTSDEPSHCATTFSSLGVAVDARQTITGSRRRDFALSLSCSASRMTNQGRVCTPSPPSENHRAITALKTPAVTAPVGGSSPVSPPTSDGRQLNWTLLSSPNHLPLRMRESEVDGSRRKMKIYGGIRGFGYDVEYQFASDGGRCRGVSSQACEWGCELIFVALRRFDQDGVMFESGWRIQWRVSEEERLKVLVSVLAISKTIQCQSSKVQQYHEEARSGEEEVMNECMGDESGRDRKECEWINDVGEQRNQFRSGNGLVVMVPVRDDGVCAGWNVNGGWKWCCMETGLMGQYGNWAYGPMWKLGLVGQAKLGLWANVETGHGPMRNWAYGPIWKLGLWASVETGLVGQCGNWAWWASVETGLMGQYRNWAYGPIWKLGLWASVETGLVGQCGNWAWWTSVETGLMGQYRNWAYGPGETGLMGQYGNWAYGPKLGLWARRNWAYGPMWKLGLWANVEIWLMGQCVNWTGWATVETGLMGQTKLGLWANVEIGLMGQCGNWAYGPMCELGLVGQCRNWAYGPDETGLMGQCGNWAYGPTWKLGLWANKLGLWARRNWAYGILKLPDEAGLLKCLKLPDETGLLKF